jgi:hypothetical protein
MPLVLVKDPDPFRLPTHWFLVVLSLEGRLVRSLGIPYWLEAGERRSRCDQTDARSP